MMQFFMPHSVYHNIRRACVESCDKTVRLTDSGDSRKVRGSNPALPPSQATNGTCPIPILHPIYYTHCDTAQNHTTIVSLRKYTKTDAQISALNLKKNSGDAYLVQPLLRPTPDPHIKPLASLEVLCNRPLQIDIYLLIYLLTSPLLTELCRRQREIYR